MNKQIEQQPVSLADKYPDIVRATGLRCLLLVNEWNGDIEEGIQPKLTARELADLLLSTVQVAIGRVVERNQQEQKRKLEEEANKITPETLISELNLSDRAAKLLTANNITTLRQMLELTPAQIQSWRNSGRKVAQEIQEMAIACQAHIEKESSDATQ